MNILSETFYKIRGFYDYCVLLKRHRKSIRESNLNLRINYALEIYTVVSLESDLDSEEFQIYGKELSRKKVSNFLNSVESFLQDKGMREYTKVISMDKVPESQTHRLLRIGYSEFSTRTLFRNIIVIVGIIAASLGFFYFM